MKIESDQVVFTSGVRHGKTTGAPITMDVINKDHQKWLDIMSAEDIEDRLKKQEKNYPSSPRSCRFGWGHQVPF